MFTYDCTKGVRIWQVRHRLSFLIFQHVVGTLMPYPVEPCELMINILSVLSP